MAGQASDPKTKKSLYDHVSAALDRVRPLMQADGGDVELLDVDDEGVVTVRLVGACCGCPSAAITLTLGIERILKQHVPAVSRVVCA